MQPDTWALNRGPWEAHLLKAPLREEAPQASVAPDAPGRVETPGEMRRKGGRNEETKKARKKERKKERSSSFLNSISPFSESQGDKTGSEGIPSGPGPRSLLSLDFLQVDWGGL